MRQPLTLVLRLCRQNSLAERGGCCFQSLQTLKDYKIILTNVHPASAACFEAIAEKQSLQQRRARNSRPNHDIYITQRTCAQSLTLISQLAAELTNGTERALL